MVTVPVHRYTNKIAKFNQRGTYLAKKHHKRATSLYLGPSSIGAGDGVAKLDQATIDCWEFSFEFLCNKHCARQTWVNVL